MGKQFKLVMKEGGIWTQRGALDLTTKAAKGKRGRGKRRNEKIHKVCIYPGTASKKRSLANQSFSMRKEGKGSPRRENTKRQNT